MNYVAQDTAAIMQCFPGVDILPVLRESLREKEKELKSLAYSHGKLQERVKKYDQSTKDFILLADEMLDGGTMNSFISLKQIIGNLKRWIMRYETKHFGRKESDTEVSFDEARQVPIMDVVSGYLGEMKLKSRQYWCRCPWHEEKTPSFSVNPQKGFFYCWSCKASGDSIKFIMRMEDCNAIEAAKIILTK